ncbi:MAG: DUF1830 domain-containing protein [Elainellaceae cyanobacterium]
MTETHDPETQPPIDPDQPKRFLPCCYVNQSDAVQLIKIKNGTDLVLERVVAPGGQVLFYSVLDGFVEVYDNDASTDASMQVVPCSMLTIVT